MLRVVDEDVLDLEREAIEARLVGREQRAHVHASVLFAVTNERLPSR